MPFPPIDKSFEGVMRELTARLGLIERRLNRVGSGIAASLRVGNISQGPGTARFVRIARIDGLNGLNGASVELQFATGGNYGSKERYTGRIHFAERDGGMKVQLISDIVPPTDSPVTFHTRTISTYVYELWASLSTYNVPLTVQVLNQFPGAPDPRVLLDMDTIVPSAPGSLSTAIKPKILHGTVNGPSPTASAGWGLYRDHPSGTPSGTPFVLLGGGLATVRVVVRNISGADVSVGGGVTVGTGFPDTLVGNAPVLCTTIVTSSPGFAHQTIGAHFTSGGSLVLRGTGNALNNEIFDIMGVYPTSED